MKKSIAACPSESRKGSSRVFTRATGVALTFALSFAALLFTVQVATAQVAPPPKLRQATGTVATSGPTQVTLLKKFGRNQARWNFTVTPKTKIDGKLTPSVRARIFYREEKGQRVAERIKVVGSANQTVPKTQPKVSHNAPASERHAWS